MSIRIAFLRKLNRVSPHYNMGTWLNQAYVCMYVVSTVVCLLLLHPLPPSTQKIESGVSLDPLQEDAVLLDLDTPAILLTAGAGTGKTHTLAARLARILGVEPRRPTELSVEKQPAVSAVSAGAEADVARLHRPHAFGEDGTGPWVRDGGWGGSRVAAHAAAPESVLVLSFTNQVCAS